MERKISTVLFILLTLSVLFVSRKVSAYQPEEQKVVINEYNLSAFNATSSDNYFNETKDPRYKLVTKPLSLLQFPNKGYPLITENNKTFSVVVSAPEDTTGWNLSLISEEANVSLEIHNAKYNTDNKKWVMTVESSQQAEGLFDLKLECSAGKDYQTHSVKLVQKLSYPFTFVQISDSHFPGYSPDINTTAINLEVINTIKDLQPDFVIHTGDLIDGPNTVFVDPNTGRTLAAEVQLKLALWALDKLETPVFIIAGNHDLDGSNLLPDNPEEVWKKYFGYNPIQNFSYIDWDFAGYSSSFNGLSETFFTDIKNHLNLTSSGSNVLYYHYDFQKQASKLIKNYPVEIALWGHEHHERLYYSQGTVYHCQDTMFHKNSFTVFEVKGASIFSVNNETYNTSTFLRETNETPSETNFSSGYVLISVTTTLIIHFVTKKKQKQRIAKRLENVS